jgi:uncharacterized protein (DUF433 family)
MLTETSYQHIRLDEKNVPILTGTTMKVIELVLEHIAYGWSPEELKYQHPYLELGQIYSALAYYYDHKEKLDQDIDSRLKKANEIEERIVLNNRNGYNPG